MPKFTLTILFAVSVAVAGLCTSTIGQQITDEEAVASAQTQGEASEVQRLPPGYTEIITHSQRRKIYAIQQSYQGQIDSLQAQIDAIESKRDAEIEQILDADQREVLKFILMIRERNRQELAAAEQESAAGEGDASVTGTSAATSPQ